MAALPKHRKYYIKDPRQIPQELLKNNREPVIQIRQVHVISQSYAWSYQGLPTYNEFTNCANLVCHYDSYCVHLVMGA